MQLIYKFPFYHLLLSLNYNVGETFRTANLHNMENLLYQFHKDHNLNPLNSLTLKAYASAADPCLDNRNPLSWVPKIPMEHFPGTLDGIILKFHEIFHRRTPMIFLKNRQAKR